MAFAAFTGKSGGTIVKFNSITLTGWRKITIEENGQPLATPLDITDAGDSTYTFVDDPLGGKGADNCTVTIEGYLSVADKQDGATGWLQFAPGDTYTLLCTTKALGDLFTLSSAVFKSFVVSEPVAGIVTYTATFSHSTSAGVWSTAV